MEKIAKMMKEAEKEIDAKLRKRNIRIAIFVGLALGFLASILFGPIVNPSNMLISALIFTLAVGLYSSLWTYRLFDLSISLIEALFFVLSFGLSFGLQYLFS